MSPAPWEANHPAWPAEVCLEGLASLDLDPETLALFLHSNARRVFRLPAAEGGGS